MKSTSFAGAGRAEARRAGWASSRPQGTEACGAEAQGTVAEVSDVETLSVEARGAVALSSTTLS
eukprot:15864935-Heterocapsa_arctica.AAC.1